MEMNSRNVCEYLLEGKPRERIALCSIEHSYSYGELADASASIACYLLERCEGTGERVILAGENSFFWVAAYLGVLRAGLVCVPVPATTSTEDAAYIIQSSDAQLAVVDGAFARKHAKALAGCHLLTNHDLPPIPAVLSQGSTAGILAAGASTGTPTAVE